MRETRRCGRAFRGHAHSRRIRDDHRHRRAGRLGQIDRRKAGGLRAGLSLSRHRGDVSQRGGSGAGGRSGRARRGRGGAHRPRSGHHLHPRGGLAHADGRGDRRTRRHPRDTHRAHRCGGERRLGAPGCARGPRSPAARHRGKRRHRDGRSRHRDGGFSRRAAEGVSDGRRRLPGETPGKTERGAWHGRDRRRSAMRPD